MAILVTKVALEKCFCSQYNSVDEEHDIFIKNFEEKNL